MILKREAPTNKLNKLPALATKSIILDDSERLIGTNVASLKLTINWLYVGLKIDFYYFLCLFPRTRNYFSNVD